MSRLFTFGCSFTKWDWITWADIINKAGNYTKFVNKGKIGAGNLYIFNKFITHLQKDSICKDDTVHIMWTNVTREDRFIDGGWATPGNLFTQDFYPKSFVKEFVDIRGCYERDIPFIHAARIILDSIGCKYSMMTMVDITNSDQYGIHNTSGNIMHLLALYNDTLSLIKPSAHKVIFDYDYHKKPSPGFDRRVEFHPLPSEHLDFVKKTFPDITITDEIQEWVNIEETKAIELIRKRCS